MNRLFATGFYSGLFPFAPGTVGSIVACLSAWALLAFVGLPAFLIATAAVVIFGVPISHAYIRGRENSDPSEVVIDEFAGQWLTFITCGVLVGYATQSPEALGYMLMRTVDEPSILVAGFVVFRMFDIIKPWPVSVADRRVKGGLGIMLDDVIAGIMAGFLLFAIISVAPIMFLGVESLP